MNVKIVCFLLGRLTLYGAGTLCLPFLAALFYGDAGRAVFGASIMLTAFLACLLLAYGAYDKYKDTISNREGIATMVFAWLLLSVVGSLPYIFSGSFDIVSALFESVSGLTTTGATVIPDVEIVPRSILLWRSLTQWLGGLGVIMIFIVLLPQLSGSAVQLFNTEFGGFSFNKMLPRMKNTAWVIFGIYLILTFAETVLLMCCQLNFFDAFNHSLTTVATGGFSTYNDGVAHFHSPLVEVVITIFMFLASVNFTLYFAATKKGLAVFKEDDEFKAYVFLLVVLSGLITLNLVLTKGGVFADNLRLAVFHVVSFSSTAGFAAFDYDKWPAFANFLLTILYFTGACSGSTAGGIKISRFLVLMKIIKAELTRVLHPSMLLKIAYNGRLLTVGQLISINCFFFIYVTSIILFSLLLAATGVSMNESIFGVASCLSSVSPGVGLIGGMSNFGTLTVAGKWVLIAAMLLGRLEFFTVLVLLRTEFWHSARRW
jgi:trk system potassium uptake protein TrkH